MQKSLKLVFLDSQGDKQSIIIPEVKEDITSAEVRNLADVILQNNIFGDDLRSLVKSVEAAITSKDVSTIVF
ncbi:DUF2922 domain-containing protein [Clostridium cylindrosporum]|uniref:DUF2922 domain-containing protein n=1 Tax=Clostridium cylindrosporum DSM 605 TaxID=1121307 RepID=A0A0J8DF80_CLOCY|nr:DUF2922 domain-containing protein [Clostridium cylindrosporum]KMT22909.1 hypothetical protein CLCY_5c01480 [Clostridium cylindrosporum DSM 605]